MPMLDAEWLVRSN